MNDLNPSRNLASCPRAAISVWLLSDTNPTNAASVLSLTILSNNLPVAVTFSSSAARLYTLRSCSNLTASIWTPVPGQTNPPGSGTVLTLTDTNPPAPAFYRVSVRLP